MLLFIGTYPEPLRAGGVFLAPTGNFGYAPKKRRIFATLYGTGTQISGNY